MSPEIARRRHWRGRSMVPSRRDPSDWNRGRDGRKFAGWQTKQTRSYFALKLPHDLWLWGVDIQLSGYIDQPQVDFFTHVADEWMADGSRLILCTGKPVWAYADPEKPHERARDGILFLDEVGELSMALQAKLLRLIQDRSFSRVGGEEQIDFKARLICATNTDLKAAIADNRFREDLFYRINVIPVAIPPMREHPEDILALVRGYLSYYAARFRRDVRSLTVAAEEAVLAHDWPGNVRELRNRVERAVALARKPRVSAQDLFPEFVDAGQDSSEMPTLKEVREQAELRHIERVLALTGGQTSAAAELLDVSRTTLWEKMRKLGLSTEEDG